MSKALSYKIARQLLTIDHALGLDSIPLAPNLPAFDTAETIASNAVTPQVDNAPPITSEPPAATHHSNQPPAPQPTPSSQPQTTTQPPVNFQPPTADRYFPMHDFPPITPNDLTTEQKIAALDKLSQEVTAFCQANWPDDGWQNVVFGEGTPDAKLMFIGEGPGADEDKLGRPFVGRAGKLLDKQIAAMGLTRDDVYIANIAKTRPPGNRVPTPEEAALTLPFLVEQIRIICPQALITLGATSAKYLLDEPKIAITKERGQWRSFCGIDLMPTLHPAFLLRQYTPENRQRVWDDLKKAMQHVGLTPPA